MRSQRSLFACLAALAAALAVAQAWTGVAELVLYFAPLLVVAGLVLSGRFVGESQAIARVRAASRRAGPARPARSALRPRLPIVAASQLDRSVRPLRGPPALLVPAA